MSISADGVSFLESTGYGDWRQDRLPGDASSRRYVRLHGPDGQTVILMEAGPDAKTQVPQFLKVASHLSGIGLCAPRIMVRSHKDQFLLIEDLGLDDLAAWLTRHPDDEAALYGPAIDVILALQRHRPPSGLPILTPKVAAQMIVPLFDWCLPDVPKSVVAIVQDTLQEVMTNGTQSPSCLALRDFHAQNLIWRPDRKGTDRIGLLDFQDAFVAAPEYDLVSLLRDARRDVAKDTQQTMIARFAAGLRRTEESVAMGCAILGVQRNLRIAGIFARLAQRDGKARYRALLPRVLRHIRSDLTHPALADLSRVLLPILPDVSQ